MEQNNILITGGAGFIGSHLALALVAKGYGVTVLDNLSKQIHGENAMQTSPLYNAVKDKVNFIHGDVTRKEDWLPALKDCSTVVHLAAETGTGQSMYQVHRYTDVNIGGTALLLDILANTKNSVSKVVIASSRAIYGEGKYKSQAHGIVFPKHRTAENLAAGRFEVTYKEEDEVLQLLATDEESKIHPSSVYGITKQNQEQMVMTVCASLGIAPVAFRYQNVYGPGQSLSNPYTGILSIFSTQIKNNLPINIFEDGKESRDFVYIDDVVNATVLGVEKEEAKGEVFNVGSGIATTVWDVANELMENYGTKVPLNITGNYRLGDIRHNYADLSKIQSVLGFQPSVSFKDGIHKFTDWVNEQQVSKSNYARSLDEMKAKGLFK